jgi:hypothetical protein
MGEQKESSLLNVKIYGHEMEERDKLPYLLSVHYMNWHRSDAVPYQ